MNRSCFLLSILFLVLGCEQAKKSAAHSYTTKFETSNGKETTTYEETIAYYIKLAKDFPEINIQSIGETDAGQPLHLVTYNPDGDFNFQKIGPEKTIVLINNGIHPGESDGIDATMMLFRDFAQNTLKTPKNVVVATIPIYNIGGALNRNSTTRANQNGPLEYGFRGNAQNYDLNRDFIKADTKNTQTFATIYHLVKPDVFIDNHVSNGADYQYTLTHLFTQHNKLGGNLGDFLEQEIRPTLEERLKAKEWDITPYVNVHNKPPETGFSQFLDHPRYSTGYTTLWNSLGMMVETHMLKPYAQRVKGTYLLMAEMVEIADGLHQKIKMLREEAFEQHYASSTYSFNWQIDSTQTTTLNFKGFEVDTLISEVTGFDRIKYDRNRPFEKPVRYQNHFYPLDTVQVPAAYLVKKSWQRVIDRLADNHIEFHPLEKDTVLLVESYRIASYQTRKSAYEGHYAHYNTKVTSSFWEVEFQEGDYLVPTHQEGIRYLLETLEPIAPDSFFNWNFFDSILQQKEGFSPYVFEDVAHELLLQNKELRERFMAKKENDPAFAQNWYAQLLWIFKNSDYYEKAHLQYPIYRIAKGSPAEKLVTKD